MSQSVAGGTKVAKNTSVNYEVSKGKEVKDVYIGNAEQNGSSESAVTSYFTNKGLKVSRSEQYHDSVPKGNVISYSPGNGSTVKEGSTVNIVVSSGPKPVETVSLQDLTGMTQANAENAIRNAGLSVGSQSTKPSSKPAGIVLDYSPRGNVKPGTAITLVISSGPCKDGSHTPDANGTCTVCGTTGLAVTPPRGDGSTENP